jgi:hypothetical protein
MQPYVIATVSSSNFTSFFPNKNPESTSDEAKDENIGKYFTIKTDSEIHATRFLDNIKAYGGKTLFTKVLSDPEHFGSSAGGMEEQYNNLYKTSSLYSVLFANKFFSKTASSLSNGFFINSSILTTFIAICAVFLLIAAAVIFLYRVPAVI